MLNICIRPYNKINRAMHICEKRQLHGYCIKKTSLVLGKTVREIHTKNA
jgi:hypothetical protein